jgi:hypothetical protein
MVVLFLPGNIYTEQKKKKLIVNLGVWHNLYPCLFSDNSILTEVTTGHRRSVKNRRIPKLTFHMSGLFQDGRILLYRYITVRLVVVWCCCLI